MRLLATLNLKAALKIALLLSASLKSEPLNLSSSRTLKFLRRLNSMGVFAILSLERPMIPRTVVELYWIVDKMTIAKLRPLAGGTPWAEGA